MKLRSQCPNDTTHKTEYDGRYDAFTCKTCDIWTEEACDFGGTDECSFDCHLRPERPSVAGPYLKWTERMCQCGHLGSWHQTPGSECVYSLNEDDEYCTCTSFKDLPNYKQG
jgi:hypothetical protein